ncbi:ArsR/SmtB family transcription factor [Streptomyces sp. 900105755]
MLRIHFTPLDLQNIRVARRPDPLWELVCAACRLVTNQGPLEFGAWRRGVLERTVRDLEARRALRLLGTLVPPVGYIPDFLTPSVPDGGLPAALAQVRATPRRRLQRELGILAGTRRLPAWTTALGRPGDRGMGSLVRALEISSKALLEPRWGQVRRAVQDEVDLRARTLLDGGVRALLESLPFARWHPPVLEVDYPVDRDLQLEGRGLLLLPSYFCWRRPTALADPTLGPVLVHPVAVRPLETVAAEGGGLERLLGRTRATVLVQVARGRTRTTSEVAQAVGIALPSASYQLAVLRDGGLVASHREGQFVRHSVTSVGHRLLGADTGRRTETDPAYGP